MPEETAAAAAASALTYTHLLFSLFARPLAHSVTHAAAAGGGKGRERKNARKLCGWMGKATKPRSTFMNIKIVAPEYVLLAKYCYTTRHDG